MHWTSEAPGIPGLYVACVAHQPHNISGLYEIKGRVRMRASVFWGPNDEHSGPLGQLNQDEDGDPLWWAGPLDPISMPTDSAEVESLRGLLVELSESIGEHFDPPEGRRKTWPMRVYLAHRAATKEQA